MKMPVLADIRKTQEELTLALAELDSIEAAVVNIEAGGASSSQASLQAPSDSAQLKERVEFLQQENRELAHNNEEIVKKFEKVHSEKEKLKSDINELRAISQKLQVDVGKVNEEKSLLSSIVKNTQEENKVLSKVMEKITREYEELKKAYEGMKCPKDDKIQALRSTARALETENELLLEEKKKIETHTVNMRAMYEQKLGDLQKESSQSKDQLRQSLEEKKRLVDQSERMENEKLSLKQQLTKCEKDLEAAKKQIEKVDLEKEEISQQNLSLDESLHALKECKRAVEIRYKNIISEKSELSNNLTSLQQQNVALDTQCNSLTLRLNQLEHEKVEQTEILAELQQNLIMKTSEYESQIRNMQIELGNRLDEINDVQKEDVDKVKGHYIELFHEKASEVMSLRDEVEKLNVSIEEYKVQIKDLQYREEELTTILNKMREGGENIEINRKIDNSYSNTQQLEAKVQQIKNKFLELQENNSNQLLKFDFHILELQKVIRDKDLEIDTLKSNLNDNESKESGLNGTEAYSSPTISKIKQDENLCTSDLGVDRSKYSKKKKRKNKSRN